MRWARLPTMVSVSSRQVEIRRSTRHVQRLAPLTALFVAGPDLPTGPASMDIPTSAALLCRLERSRFEFGTLLSRRYLVASRDWVPKSAHWMTFVLVHLPSKKWKIFMRVERSTFATLETLLREEGQDVFAGGVRGPKQASVALQLKIALFRFGHHGNAACTLNSTSSGHGFSVHLTGEAYTYVCVLGRTGVPPCSEQPQRCHLNTP